MRSAIAPAASAALLYASFLPEWGFPLAHIALVPALAAFLRGSRLSSIWFFGCVFAAFYFFWLKVFTPLAPVVLTLSHGLWIVLGFLPAVWVRRSNRPVATLLAVAAGWVASEWLRSLGPYGYEWGSVGYTQYGSLKMAGFSAVGGIWLVSFLVLGSNILFTLAWVKKDQRWIWAAAGYGLLLWAASPFPEDLPATIGSAKEFALIQTNINPYAKSLDREQIMREQLRSLSAEAARARAKNMILPETLFSTDIVGMRGYLTEEPRALLMKLLDPSPDRRLLVGAIETDEKGFYNSAILFDAQGQRVSSYRKQHLVPFGETIPWLENFKPARDFGEKLGTPFFSAGDTLAPLLIGGSRVAMLICFEGSFSRLVRESARGADLIINISNDAWSESRFGHDQHLRFLRFRAVETGLPVLRVGNSGPTALYAPNGKLAADIPYPAPGVLDLGSVTFPEL